MSLQNTHTFEADNLFAGSVQPVVAGSETLLAGQGVILRGTVLGSVTASSKLKIVDSASSDDSQAVYAILAADTDTTDGDVDAPVYYTGEYNKNELVFGGSDTADTHKTQARNIGIFFKDVIAK